jgi:hypothetical protein
MMPPKRKSAISVSTKSSTALYKQVYEAAGDIKPKNISIDTLSRAFAGNEIDRVQVYAFAGHMQALAMVAGGSVTVLSHPSLAGIASGSDISGSTAWHGAFRFRQYLKGTKPEPGSCCRCCRRTDREQPEGDLRELEFKKNQYGPTDGETIVLRYQRGLFLPEAGVSNLDKLAREAEHRGIVDVRLDGRIWFAGVQKDFGENAILEAAKRRPITSAVMLKHFDFSTATIWKAGAAHCDGSRFEAIAPSGVINRTSFGLRPYFFRAVTSTMRLSSAMTMPLIASIADFR